MSNVLPLEKKQELLKRFRARCIMVLALTLLVGAGIASASLIPAFVSVRVAESSVAAAPSAESGARDDQAKLVRAQTIVGALMPLVSLTSTHSTPSETFSFAIGLKPAGISVTGISYSKGSLMLTGVSNSRDAVNAYREALEESKHFSAVNVPVAALVGAQEGRFTVTLSGAF